MNTAEKLSNIYKAVWTLPSDIDDLYIRGNYINQLDENAYFEVPAIFSEDGVLDETKTLDTLINFIEFMNRQAITALLNNP